MRHTSLILQNQMWIFSAMIIMRTDMMTNHFGTINILHYGGANMSEHTRDTEELRKKLLADVYAGAVSGLGAMLLDESRIKNADEEELERIAREYGY